MRAPRDGEKATREAAAHAGLAVQCFVQCAQEAASVTAADRALLDRFRVRRGAGGRHLDDGHGDDRQYEIVDSSGFRLHRAAANSLTVGIVGAGERSVVAFAGFRRFGISMGTAATFGRRSSNFRLPESVVAARIVTHSPRTLHGADQQNEDQECNGRSRVHALDGSS